MKLYELLYIATGAYTEPETDALLARVAELIQKNNGKIVRQEALGKIKLAFPVKNVKYGTYIQAVFEIEPSNIVPIDKEMRMTDGVLRHSVSCAREGVAQKRVELTAYVQPLSPEGKRQYATTSSARRRVPSKRPVVTQQIMQKDQTPMSVEDLEKKLDQILEQKDFQV